MTFNGILQIIAFLLVLTILTKPVGIYLTRVYSGETTFLQPIERAFYWLTRVDAGERDELEAIWRGDAAV